MRCLAALILCALCGCSSQAQQTAIDRLRPCANDEGPTDAYCGTLTVFENRDTREGPHDRSEDRRPAGAQQRRASPTRSSFSPADRARAPPRWRAALRELFRRVQADRDIVLVDQRGTGKSNPLNCTSGQRFARGAERAEQVGLDRLRKCLESYDADPRSTRPASRWTIWTMCAPISATTRSTSMAARTARARRWSTCASTSRRVRAIVLDGVAPPDMRLPLFFARDAQRALDQLAGRLREGRRSCRTQYPQSGRAHPRRCSRGSTRSRSKVRLTHPRTGVAEDVTVEAAARRQRRCSARCTRRSPSSLVPALIERAERNDFQGLLALALDERGPTDNMSVGHAAVGVCARGLPRASRPKNGQRASAGTVFGDHLHGRSRMQGVRVLAEGDSASRRTTSRSRPSVPTLVLSGELDPVTPPSWGESVTKHVCPNARHLVCRAPVTASSARLRHAHRSATFIDRGSADGLDDAAV